MFKRHVLEVVLAAVLYLVAGKLALLLAIPPGYATAIWPAAGIALALLLIKGYHLWPGVLLGSFLVNVDVTGFQGQRWADFYPTLWLPFVISVGASVQAVVGVWLLRRFVTYPCELDTVRSVWCFIFYVCGVGSMIAATVGTTALWLGGDLASENYWFNWFTWWVGDGLGIMIFTTLLLVFYGEPREVWLSRRKILPAVLLGATFIIVSLYVTASRWELSRQQADFSGRSEQIFQRAQSLMNAHLATLYSVQGLFAASTEVTREDFRVFAEGVLARNPGFQALAWNVRVSASERQLIESQMSAERQAPVFVTRRADNGELVLQSNETDYVVIRYIEPLQENLAALGYDIASADLPRKALLRANAINSPAVTDPIRLVQESGDQLGLVIYLPVSNHGVDESPVLLGYVSGVFRVEDLMGLLLPNILQGVSVSVSSPAGKLLYRSDDRVLSDRDALFGERRTLQVADQQWQFRTDANQVFLVGTRSIVPWVMLAVGLMFTGLLGMTFLVLTGQKHRSDTASEELKLMLGQLQETQEHLVEAEKMASLGGLVAGFAHELNTPLGIAITAGSTLDSDLRRLNEMQGKWGEASVELGDLLQRLQDASRIVLANIQRAGGLISSFKQVSVDQATAETREINLHEYLNDVFVHLSPSYRRSGHEVVLSCPKTISMRTVPGGLAQVIINLLNNSLIHAFPEGEHGRIELRVVQHQSTINLVFSDNGVGMATDQTKKIFEPFFTTRRGSGGTGLGLHLVYNIVRQQLQGHIKVSTQPGRGMRFDIELPLAINKFVATDGAA
ncbi:CHASE domain-containing protein [Zhongshania sp.]|uniref:CHASE domain-containing protein n=1 Tax=Zhongshania sp. TaxID=1971902 RepID=UPI00356B116E